MVFVSVELSSVKVEYCLHHAQLIFVPLHFSSTGKRIPQLVLLDHGLYKELDNETRTNYAALWKVHFCFSWNDFL